MEETSSCRKLQRCNKGSENYYRHLYDGKCEECNQDKLYRTLPKHIVGSHVITSCGRHYVPWNLRRYYQHVYSGSCRTCRRILVPQTPRKPMKPHGKMEKMEILPLEHPHHEMEKMEILPLEHPHHEMEKMEILPLETPLRNRKRKRTHSPEEEHASLSIRLLPQEEFIHCVDKAVIDVLMPAIDDLVPIACIEELDHIDIYPRILSELTQRIEESDVDDALKSELISLVYGRNYTPVGKAFQQQFRGYVDQERLDYLSSQKAIEWH